MRQTSVLSGRSTAGIGTSILAHGPGFSLIFDIGNNLRENEVPFALLTHGHVDHVTGLPLWIERCLMRRVAPTILCS